VNSSGRRETTGEGRKELEPRVKDERQSKVRCTFCYLRKQIKRTAVVLRH
jgi:hypothetical protein